MKPAESVSAMQPSLSVMTTSVAPSSAVMLAVVLAPVVLGSVVPGSAVLTLAPVMLALALPLVGSMVSPVVLLPSRPVALSEPMLVESVIEMAPVLSSEVVTGVPVVDVPSSPPVVVSESSDGSVVVPGVVAVVTTPLELASGPALSLPPVVSEIDAEPPASGGSPKHAEAPKTTTSRPTVLIIQRFICILEHLSVPREIVTRGDKSPITKGF